MKFDAPSRRAFIRSLSRSAGVFAFDQLVQALPLPVQFVNVAREAGLAARTVFGGERRNKFLLETTGYALLDHDRHGHPVVCGANFIDFDPKPAPLPESGPCTYAGILVACGPPGLQGGKNLLFHNNGNGTFTDVSAKAGILSTPGTY